ncbi:hypothetical protein ABH926_004840 [Catenulispora sp. GP43]|uniref:hypothetical protein n=1 Tax=Catenulispora sp. GP43 TaxID=3156263 RepID=UPI0035114A0E
MEFESWDQMREPDQRALRFTPWGLGPQMRPEDNADYLQKVLATFDLAPQVAEGTQRSFDRLRGILPYGILNYEIFTAVADLALLTTEQALRDRFLEHHQGTVVFVDPAGVNQAFPVSTYEDVYRLAQKKGKANAGLIAAAKKASRPVPALWELRVTAGSMRFDGMLSSLRGWARQLGLLLGQRNRRIEGVLTKLRNEVAHPGGYNLDTPVQALSTLSDLAEIINQLWGKRTPGGHLYPTPVHRDVTAFAWRSGDFISMAAENVQHATDLDEDYQYAIALAVTAGPRSDPDLPRFDSLYETTAYPVDLLWGPGTRTQAIEWLENNRPVPDEFDHLDRLFSLRADGGQLSMPRRPEIAAGLPPEERDGRWYLVRADYPNDAFTHARNLEDGATRCAATGPCRACHAETVISGTFAETVAALNLEPLTPPVLRGPFAGPRSMPAGPTPPM